MFPLKMFSLFQLVFRNSFLTFIPNLFANHSKFKSHKKGTAQKRGEAQLSLSTSINQFFLIQYNQCQGNEGTSAMPLAPSRWRVYAPLTNGCIWVVVYGCMTCEGGVCFATFVCCACVWLWVCWLGSVGSALHGRGLCLRPEH